jgi:hypothetical protein
VLATRWATQVGFEATPDLNPRVRLDGTGQAWVVAFAPVSSIACNSLSYDSFNVAVDDEGYLLFAATATGSTNLGGGEQYDANGRYVSDNVYPGVVGPDEGRTNAESVEVDASGNC